MSQRAMNRLAMVLVPVLFAATIVIVTWTTTIVGAEIGRLIGMAD